MLSERSVYVCIHALSCLPPFKGITAWYINRCIDLADKRGKVAGVCVISD